jgi:hypothetical protein
MRRLSALGALVALLAVSACGGHGSSTAGASASPRATRGDTSASSPTPGASRSTSTSGSTAPSHSGGVPAGVTPTGSGAASTAAATATPTAADSPSSPNASDQSLGLRTGRYTFSGSARYGKTTYTDSETQTVTDLSSSTQRVVSTTSSKAGESSLTVLLAVHTSGLFVTQAVVSSGQGAETFTPTGPALLIPHPVSTTQSWKWTAESSDHKYTLQASYRGGGAEQPCSADHVAMQCVHYAFTWVLRGNGITYTQTSQDTLSVQLDQPVLEATQSSIAYTGGTATFTTRQSLQSWPGS